MPGLWAVVCASALLLEPAGKVQNLVHARALVPEAVQKEKASLKPVEQKTSSAGDSILRTAPEVQDGKAEQARLSWFMLALFVTLSALFLGVRFELSTIDPLRYCCEMITVAVLGGVGFFCYLYAEQGFTEGMVFVHCMGLELLLGVDDVLNMVGWYTGVRKPQRYLMRIILSYGLGQCVVRLVILPWIVSSLESVGVLIRIAGVVLTCSGMRYLYVAVCGDSDGLPQLPFVGLSFAMRAILVEIADVLGHTDSFVAKLVATNNTFANCSSAILAVLIQRALVIIVLVNEERGVPLQLFRGMAGLLLVPIGLHATFPAFPALPAVVKLGIPVVLYAYLCALVLNRVGKPHEASCDAARETKPCETCCDAARETQPCETCCDAARETHGDAPTT